MSAKCRTKPEEAKKWIVISQETMICVCMNEFQTPTMNKPLSVSLFSSTSWPVGSPCRRCGRLGNSRRLVVAPLPHIWRSTVQSGDRCSWKHRSICRALAANECVRNWFKWFHSLTLFLSVWQRSASFTLETEDETLQRDRYPVSLKRRVRD